MSATARTAAAPILNTSGTLTLDFLGVIAVWVSADLRRNLGERVLLLLIGVLLSAGHADRVERATHAQPHSGILLVTPLDVGGPFFVRKAHRGDSENRAAPRAAEIAGGRALAPFVQAVAHQ